MISIVIPAYNNLDSVRSLVKSIYRQFNSAMGEVIVVDDNSMLCNMNILKDEFTGLKVVRLPENKGAANARSVGVKNASYDIIFFLDSDMQLCDNVIEEVRKTMSNGKNDATVGTVRDVPLNRGIFQDYWALLKSYFHSLPLKYSTTFYPMVGVIKKKIFDDVGGFDEKIRGASVEDYEFSMRLLNKGYKVLYNPKILVSTSYKDFFTSIRQSMKRSKKWTILFLDRKKFDNHTTTLSQGLANILGFSIWLLLVGSFFNVYILAMAILFFVLFLYTNKGFFTYVIQRRGIIFFVITVFIYLVSSFFITIGSFLGALYIFRSKESRRRALYA